MSLLKEAGIGIFVVFPGFFFHIGGKTVYQNLAKFGLFVEAIFSLPRGAYAPLTNISANLVVTRKGKAKPIFVAELAADQSSMSTLIENFIYKREGQEPELGVIVEPASFRSCETSITECKISRISQKAGLTKYKSSMDKNAMVIITFNN